MAVFTGFALVAVSLVIGPVNFVKSESFCHSVSDLESLAVSDLIFYRQLKSLRSNFSRIAAIQQTIEKAKKAKDSFPPKFRHFIDDFESSTGYTYSNLDHPTKVLANNPIAVYRLLRRIVTVTPEIVKLEKYGFAISLAEHREHFGGRWPDQTDLNEAIDGLLQLHHIYDLNITEFSEGNIFGVPTGIKLEAFHCFEIGVHAKMSKYYSLAVEWLEASLQKLYSVLDDSVDEAEVVDVLDTVIKQHDEELESVDRWQPFFFTHKLQSRDYRRENRVSRRNQLYTTFKGRTELKYKHINYWALCSGENLQPDEIKSRLFCWLERKLSKALLIGPLKMELLARNPDIVQIYDLVGDSGIELIKKQNEIQTDEAGIIQEGSSSKNNHMRSNNKREYTFEELTVDNTRKELRMPINEKLKQLIGFKKTAHQGEPLHVTSHHYASDYHLSPAVKSTQSLSDSESQTPSKIQPTIATLTISLSDVQLGGYTVFPSSLVAAKPTKGSGFLHYDVYKDGSPDFLTTRLSCPVVLGQKWSATMRINYADQFPNLKCGLFSKERFLVEVNGNTHKAESSSSETDGSDMVDEHQAYWQQAKNLFHGSLPGVKILVVEEARIYSIIKAASILEVRDDNDTNVDRSMREAKRCLENYINDYEETTGKLMNPSPLQKSINENDANKIAHNLLASYRMAWRFRKYLRKLLWSNPSMDDTNKNFYQIVMHLQRSYGVTEWPDKVFLEDSITGILVIQHIHDLLAADIASGIVNGLPHGIVLKAIHMYEIGKFALSRDYYSQGVEWLELAFSKVSTGADLSVDNSTVLEELKNAVQLHNHALAKSAGWEPLFFSRPVYLSDNRVRVRRKVKQYNAFKLQDDPDLSEINFWGVCSGKPHQTEEQKSRLFCWYETQVDPYWRINPLKAELHSMRPKLEIVQFYDILSDPTVDGLKSAAASKLNKSPIKSFYTSGVDFNSDWRLSAHSPISAKSQEGKLMASTISSLTGLNTLGKQESLEVASYMPGGHYNVHLDSVGHGEGIIAPRIASVMFSLSDVEHGGDAAFAQAGVRIKPAKGSAIFWYNLLDSGDVNDYSWHGICPLISGEYWVATQWLNYEEQISHRRCGPQQTESYEILVNGKSKY